jgi:hypothetical protein
MASEDSSRSSRYRTRTCRSRSRVHRPGRCRRWHRRSCRCTRAEVCGARSRSSRCRKRTMRRRLPGRRRCRFHRLLTLQRRHGPGIHCCSRAPRPWKAARPRSCPGPKQTARRSPAQHPAAPRRRRGGVWIGRLGSGCASQVGASKRVSSSRGFAHGVLRGPGRLQMPPAKRW